MLTREFAVTNYDLSETLRSGQAFRWRETEGAWEGIVAGKWYRLSENKTRILAQKAEAGDEDWNVLRDYLQLEVDLEKIIQTFPKDPYMDAAVSSCWGLRLLRQEPWECLASFILSSTKQIVQIQQIVNLVSRRFGEPAAVPQGHESSSTFPGPERIVSLSEAELRCCKMGFRAPYLKGSAEMIVNGEVKLDSLRQFPVEEARQELMRLPGVGRKIADCVLLFAYGFQEAFPIDVWVMKALRQLYFPKRRKSAKKLVEFTQTYFGPNAGYAQQYLFHYMRTKIPRT